MPVSTRGQSAFVMLPPPKFEPTPAPAIDVQALARSIPPEIPALALTTGQIENIAWDMALLPERQADICAFYKISPAQWGVLIETPAFQAGTRHAAAALKTDPNLAARVVARGAMTDAVKVASDLAKSTLVEPRDRLKAIELLSRFVAMEDTGVGAENRRAKSGHGGGATVTLNFGTIVGQALKQVIVERDE